MKDNFSKQASEYAKYRPGYPTELVDFIISHVPQKNCVWDCGTGNGQLAVMLAEHFTQVYATDLSENQLVNAQQRPNITYHQATAEESIFEDNQFDLVTVAQAIHWFEFDRFYTQVKRVLKHNGIMAAITYYLPSIDKPLDVILRSYYKGILGPYWDPERKYIDDKYKTIPFPFDEIETPVFESANSWSREDFMGFLRSWSARQHYIRETGSDPLDLITREVQDHWPEDQQKEVRFPFYTRMGKN